MLSALPIRSASVAIRLVSRPVCAALVGPARSTWVRAAAAWEHRVWEPWVLGRGAATARRLLSGAVVVSAARGECAR